MKNELVAYFIMESFSEPMKPKNVEVIKNDLGLWTVRFYSHLQDFDVTNRNGRMYTSEAMIPALSTSEIQELIRYKRWMGEFDHPMLMGASDKEAVTRICNVLQKYASHWILSIDVSKSGVSGWIETRPLGAGKEFAADIICGSEPSFSLRALAKIERTNGMQIIRRQPRVITFDSVILPSHKIAYRDKSKPISLIKGSDTSIVRECMDISKGRGNNDRNFKEDLSFQMVNESLNDFIMMESANIKMISNQEEVSLENMTVTKDCKHVILSENGGKYIVNLEDQVSHIVTETMSKFFN